MFRTSLMLTLSCFLCGCSSPDKSLTLRNNYIVFYTKNVSDSDAMALGAFFEKELNKEGTVKAMRLDKRGHRFDLYIPVKTGMDRDEADIPMWKAYCSAISKQAFHGAPVDIHLCGENWKTLRVVTLP